MKRSSGYALLFLIMIITMLSLSSSVAVIQQDTRLKRYTEQELKLNLDAVRRAFDLYVLKENPSEALMTTLREGTVASLTSFLAEKGYLRRSAWSQASANPNDALPSSAGDLWQFRRNLIRNSSFEDDFGYVDANGIPTSTSDPYIASVTVKDDGKPDYWNIDEQNWTVNKSATQKIYKDLLTSNATYVISYWGRWSPPVNATSEFSLSVIRESDGAELKKLKGNSKHWKRYFAAFFLPTAATLTVKLTVNSNKGEAAYFDGLMLERWMGSDTMTPFPSAWAKDFVVTSAIASVALQQTQVFGLTGSDSVDLPEGWVHRFLEW